jgi:hypothetical protein
MVAEERRLRPEGGDQVGGELVQLGEPDAGRGRVADGGEGTCDDPAGLAHGGQLGLGLQHNHAEDFNTRIIIGPWCVRR